jgi:tetrapyrrole methylase family protein/MazG family protein
MDDKFSRLVELVSFLRSDKGCPWDREQTLDTIRSYLVEETYEVIEAVEEGDFKKLKEELGDLLFELLFVAQLAREKSKFDISDVISGVIDKMINRHPHVFGETKVDSSSEVVRNWNELKKKEKIVSSLLDGVPERFPALMRAYKLTERVATVGFDWRRVEEILDKLSEEISELETARLKKDMDGVEKEVGDVLFVAVNIARFLKINPELALTRANRRFERRFRYLERKLKEKGEMPAEVGLEEMEALWQESKREEKKRRLNK